MLNTIILASKSGVRKKILEDNKIICKVEPSNVDEESIKESLLKEKASPEIISKNLAELKANNVALISGEVISYPRIRLKSVKPLFPPKPVLFIKNNNRKAYNIA